MKQITFSFTLLLIITCTLMGCKASSTKATATVDSLQAKGADTLVVDSILYKMEQDSTLSCQITVDYPTEPDSLSLSVRNYISQELWNQYLPIINDEANAKKYPKYNSSLTKGKDLVDFYGKGTFSYLQQEYHNMKESVEDNHFNPQLSYEVHIKKTAETDSYLTYHISTYAYLAGAHGSATDYHVNISKNNKKVLTNIIDKQKLKEIQPILRKGILQYLNKEAEEKINEEKLNDYLFIENGIIPLPSHTPYLAKDGVHFIYQQYEIGPYAMGMVQFTVPYKEITPFLTIEAQKLIK